MSYYAEMGKLYMKREGHKEGGRTMRIAHNTEMFTEGVYLQFRFHSTIIVSVDANADEIVLDSGGWRTTTMQRRINQIAEALGLGIVVKQIDHAWIVFLANGEEICFQDGMSIDRIEKGVAIC